MINASFLRQLKSCPFQNHGRNKAFLAHKWYMKGEGKN